MLLDKRFHPNHQAVLAALSINGLRAPPAIVVWNYDTFDNNFDIDNDVTKYLKGGCWFMS